MLAAFFLFLIQVKVFQLLNDLLIADRIKPVAVEDPLFLAFQF